RRARQPGGRRRRGRARALSVEGRSFPRAGPRLGFSTSIVPHRAGPRLGLAQRSLPTKPAPGSGSAQRSPPAKAGPRVGFSTSIAVPKPIGGAGFDRCAEAEPQAGFVGAIDLPL